MNLYVRQSAWLNTAPERPAHDKSKERRLTRLESMRIDRNDDGYHPGMPDTNAKHIIGYLFEIGPVQATSNGIGPVTHGEIKAWIELIGIDLQPWEVRFLRKLSYDYLEESRKAEKTDCQPPWGQQQWTQEHREVVSKKVQHAMRSFMRAERR